MIKNKQTEIEIAFRQIQLFTKDEVLQSLDLTIEYLQYDEDLNYTDEMRKNKLELCYKFKEKLEKCQLPQLSELWWFYDYNFTGDGIELWLRTASDIEIDDDGCISMSVTDHHRLISVKCDYLTVEQYAKIQKVEPVTVRQWIRRGKLRHARKSGRDWLIPSIEEKPSRGYNFVQYLWDELSEELLEVFPFLSMCTSLSIYQDDEVKTKFICNLENFETKHSMKMEMTRQEVEKLELALISSGKVTRGDTIQFKPNIKR